MPIQNKMNYKHLNLNQKPPVRSGSHISVRLTEQRAVTHN